MISATWREESARLVGALIRMTRDLDLTTQVDFIEDDVLRLIFLSCHPRLTAEPRAALTLRRVRR